MSTVLINIRIIFHVDFNNAPFYMKIQIYLIKAQTFDF